MARHVGYRRGESARRLLMLTVASFALATPNPARADEAPDTALPAPPARSVGTVTVTATRAERDVLEVPGNVTVISREEIERSGAQSLPELLRREAGLFVARNSTSPEGYSVEARGFANGSGVGSSLLVLVDGRRVNEADSSVTDWALTHLDYVERIEIVRGPTSALYGDNAVGGTIQIITRSPEGAPRVTVRGHLGSEQTGGGSLVASGAIGPVGFSLFSEYRGSDGFRDRSDFRGRDMEGKLRFELGSSAALTLSSGYSSDDRDRPGSLSAVDLASLGRDAADPRQVGNFDRTRRRFVQGALDVTPNDDTRFHLLSFFRQRHDTALVTDAFLGVFDIDTETSALGLNGQFELAGSWLGYSHRMLFGIDLLREDLDSESLSSDPFFGNTSFKRSGRREAGGVFLQEELALAESLLLSLGVRRDRARYHLEDRQDALPEKSTRPDYDIWSPRAALTWLLADGASAYASYSRGFRFPNFDETSGVFGANPSIRPQKSDAYEIGLKLRHERLTAHLAVFHMDVDDEILLDSSVATAFDFDGPGGDPPVQFLSVQNVNMERVRHRGIELSASLRPVDRLDVYGSYTFDDTEIRRDTLTGLAGNRVPLTPRHRGSVGALVQLPFWLEVGADANFVGSRFAVNDFGHDLPKLSKWAVYDAHVAFRPPLQEGIELALSFAVNNLFDRDYEEVGGRPSFPPLLPLLADPSSFLRFSPAPDRNWRVGLTITVTP